MPARQSARGERTSQTKSNSINWLAKRPRLPEVAELIGDALAFTRLAIVAEGDLRAEK
jgi:hypothetical protein